MRYPEIVGFENVQMNESSVYYRDIFEAVQHDIEDYRDEKYLHRYTAAVNPQPIFDFKDDDLWRYKGLIEKSRGTARAAIITIVKALMIKNNVVTYQPELHSKGDGYQTLYFDIVFKDKTNQKIGIRFFWDGQDAIPLDDLFDRIDKFGVKKEVEKIYFILLEHSYHKEQTESKDKRYYYNEYEYKQIEGFNKIADEYTNGFVRFIEFESFFVNWFGLEEYNKFIKAVESFNNRAKSLVGYKALFMPNKEEIDHLRIARFNELRQFDYKGALTNALNRLKNSINNTEFKLLTAEIDNFHKICMDNYYNRLRLAVLVSDEDFSNSFISSEWYYDTSFSTDILDKTAIVVGYLKSVEQLLYRIICFHLGNENYKIQHRHLKKKEIQMYFKDEKKIPGRVPFVEEYEEIFDKTFGSLNTFVDNYKESLFHQNIGNHWKKFIVNYLYQYCKNERNDHLHKDNIYKTTEVNAVRESTFLLYFLLLGAFKISDSDIQKLGFNTAIEQTGIMGLWILAVRFWEWVMPILNTCETNDSIICFDPCYIAEGCEELRIAETKSFDVVDYENELKKLKYHEDVFLFDLGNERTDKEKGEILSAIIRICLNYRKETMNDRHRYVLILYGFGYEIL